ncbi:MAG: toll/interleukin-1 receptor domain-containing protein [Gammaproteobacteria bacterium]|nr:toll/interleukin-1 receptor domain-containing protein [Gammaproteobacteria bacterium]
MTRQNPMKVFLSHSHTDAPLAARISEALEESGLQVWDSDRNLLPGDNWAGETARALEESDAMVVLLTPAAVSSPYVKREIEYALGSKNYSNRLIPVVVGNPDSFPANKIPWILQRMNWVGLEYSETEVPRVKPIADAILAAA